MTGPTAGTSGDDQGGRRMTDDPPPDALPSDWAAALAAQGVPEGEIADARALARRQAEAAAHAPHDPLGAADPAAWLALLRGAAR